MYTILLDFPYVIGYFYVFVIFCYTFVYNFKQQQKDLPFACHFEYFSQSITFEFPLCKWTYLENWCIDNLQNAFENIMEKEKMLETMLHYFSFFPIYTAKLKTIGRF